MRWIKDKSKYFTPGGDPVWICPYCGGGRHVYGVENTNEPMKECSDCGMAITDYEWMERKCKNCKCFHRLKHNFEVGKGYEESSCCVALARMNDDYGFFVMQVDENGFCEMYMEREEEI